MWTYVAPPQKLADPEWGLRREWLLTNGLGGYAATSVLGCNTRRYHGLLVAAMAPPLDRWVLLSHLDELLVTPGGQEHYLNTTEYPGGFFPGGFKRLSDFALDPLPAWRWTLPGGIEVTRRLCMIYGADAVTLQYEVSGDELDGARLVLSPFVALRSFHHLAHQRPDIQIHPSDAGNGFRIPVRDGRDLLVHASAGSAAAEPVWYNEVRHRAETERGQDDLEDLLRIGAFTLGLAEARQVTVTAHLTPHAEPPTFDEAVRHELDRRRWLCSLARPGDQREQALVIAADQFLVDRPSGEQTLVSILAGYPWFADWGRDTMIALPGVCLATGRADRARDVLRLWASLVDQGMLPNRFEDDNRQLSYNAVDSALWFVQATNALMAAAPDDDLLRDVLWPAVCQILDGYARGTRYGIRADSDGLLAAGDAKTQLTWMDAKQGDVAFTPRHGKAVEINALWLSALSLAGEWAARLGVLAPPIVERQQQAREAFYRTFWNHEAGCLYDCVGEAGPDGRIRPNQLLAVSLPRPALTGDAARGVVDVCRRKLLTPVGLRTLDPDAPDYRGRYAGGWMERDGAYHQGTVWAWLLGPYVDALIASADVHSAANSEAQQVVDQALRSLDEGAIGTIGEIFHGDPPHEGCGAVAQAWSVAELLRVKRTHGL